MRKNKTLTKEQIEQAKEYYQKFKWTCRRTGLYFNMHWKDMRNILILEGVKIRDIEEDKNFTEKQFNVILWMYFERCLSKKQIADIHKVSEDVIKHELKRAGYASDNSKPLERMKSSTYWRNLLEKQYCKEKKSLRKLEKVIHLNRKALTELVKHFGLEQEPLTLEERYNIDKLVYEYDTLQLDFHVVRQMNHIDHYALKECLLSRGVHIRGNQEAAYRRWKIMYEKAERGEISLDFKTDENKFQNYLKRGKFGEYFDMNFFDQFENYEIFHCIVRMINNGNGRDGDITDPEIFKALVLKAYYDPFFREQYELWKETGNKWDKPSYDHIIPVSRGGTSTPENMHVMSWYDNQKKSTMLWSEWLEQEEKSVPGSKEYLINKYRIDEFGNRLNTSFADTADGAFLLSRSKERISTNRSLVDEIMGYLA